MNRCTVDESFGLKSEASAVFRVVLSAYGDINLLGTKEELQVCKD